MVWASFELKLFHQRQDLETCYKRCQVTFRVILFSFILWCHFDAVLQEKAESLAFKFASLFL